MPTNGSVTVTISPLGVSPDPVPITVGGHVTWTSSDGGNFSITFDSGTHPGNPGNSHNGTVTSGAFNAAGTVKYTISAGGTSLDPDIEVST